MENSGQSISLGEAQFLQLVSMFQIAALQQMGKLVNPITNEVERNLDQAKASIDLIEMIKDKTKGNLSKVETDYLDKVLFELHMNYVDEADKDAKEGKKGGKTAGADAKESPKEKDEKGAGEPASDAAPDEKEV